MTYEVPGALLYIMEKRAALVAALKCFELIAQERAIGQACQVIVEFRIADSDALLSARIAAEMLRRIRARLRRHSTSAEAQAACQKPARNFYRRSHF